jgi:hypothetical protein
MITTNSDLIQQLYIAFFGRPADPGGLNHWTYELDNGTSLSSIREQFAQSAEFQSLMTGRSSVWQVNQLYQNLFGREADLNGLSYYTSILEQGRGSIGSVVGDILRGASGGDPELIHSKVVGAQLFTAALGVDWMDVIDFLKMPTLGSAYLSAVSSDQTLIGSMGPLADQMEGVVRNAGPAGRGAATPTEGDFPVVIRASAEYVVQELYLAYFKRPADLEGLVFWTNSALHASPEEISQAFATSSEYQQSIQGLDHRQVVDRLFVNLFGHHGGSESLQLYGEALASGRATVDQVLNSIILGAQAEDRELLDNRTIAAQLFTTSLKINETYEIKYAAGQMPGAGFLDAVTSDASVYDALRSLPELLEDLVTIVGVSAETW